jgi:Dolichyl-phosphate-mannose-protein mannosyltransferase
LINGRSHAAIARATATIAALAAALAGVIWGTHVAGGPDSYCYLSQAEMFASGHISHSEPLATLAPWKNGPNAFVPVGHVPAARTAGASVPMCSPGYPIAMAIARMIGGRTAMFAIVPLCGAAAVWLTFVLARRLRGDISGALAAVLLTASPAFLYQVVQPMSDVPAAAAWAAALVAVSDPRFGTSPSAALLAGLATGLAILVRPNLAPLAAIVALAVFVPRPIQWRRVARDSVVFGVGVLPSVILVALLQNEMYGGPLKSGYGNLGFLFRLDHVWPNLQRYPAWLLQTETPIVLLAVATPWLAHDTLTRRRVTWLLAFVAAVFACYIPYEVFDAWWYLRFVLPAYPGLLALTASAVVWLLARRSWPWQAAGFAVAALVVMLLVRESVQRHAFGLWEFERRFRLAGEYIGSRLPANAILFAAQESGSVRFYAGRPTIAWRELPPQALDDALAFVRAHGYRPYFLIENGEQQEFVAQFEQHSAVGSLGWPARADINHMVRLYDPDEYARYRAGEPIRTERIWVKEKRVLDRYF